ncbi:MAG TPA: FAD-binding protein [Gemmataceae bacterium]|nr:FAD-binding protein [Gemmataceae bacterium]
MDEILLIAGANDPVIADYARSAARSGRKRITLISDAGVCGQIKESVELHTADGFSRTDYLSRHSQDRIAVVVIFPGRSSTGREQGFLDAVADIAVEKRVDCVCIVSSFQAHFGDSHAIQAEESLVGRLKEHVGRIVVFRPAHILSPRSRLNEQLRKLRFLAPLVPARFITCCIEGEELFAAIEQQLETGGARKRRTYTMLGTNISWKALLTRKSSENPPGAFVRVIALLLRLSLMGQVVGLLFDMLTRWFPALQSYNCDTLYPKSVEELLSVYNKYNYRSVKIVGYNNGVVHFGHSYPGRTVISTIRCNGVARVKGDRARFDGGVTIHQAMEVLRKEGKELHVVPNYSYVSMGTSYFIPIHGSASSYSTIAETIEKVLLYDPVADRFIAAARKDAAFGQYMYNLAADALLLRMTVRVKEKSDYFIKALQLADPSSEEILSYFHDQKASNVEIRKAKAASPEVKVSLYFTEGAEDDTAALELPRDRLGTLWDRLEANPITSLLFHGLIRRLAHHVELFLSEKDFAIFWETHRTLPLSKIQLRYIKRDSMPHSPFRQHDCVSADLFMLKKHKSTFEAYLRETLPLAGFNPGKHSK